MHTTNASAIKENKKHAIK